MSIKALNIETVFSGGIHLLWLALLTFKLLGKSPEMIFSELSQIASGTGVLLAAILFSVSFFIGRIAEHFIIAINYLFSKKKTRQTYVKDFKGTSSDIWGNKIFSLSSFVGLLIFGIMLYSMTNSWNEILAILVIGTILLTETASSFFYWYYLGKRVPLDS
ncbi:MAG TPA: hypothetical protein VIZ21_04510 [Ignavibacteriaceae bacterium]